MLERLLGRLVGDVRGTLIGMITGLFLTVLTLAGVLWNNHLSGERAVDDAQQVEINRIWADANERDKRWTAQIEEYKAVQAEQLTKRLAFEAKYAAIQERMDAERKDDRERIGELERGKKR